jgi:hypothetical protein
MHHPTAEEIGLDYRALLELIGEERVIELIGTEQVLAIIGKEAVVEWLQRLGHAAAPGAASSPSSGSAPATEQIDNASSP